MNSAARHEAAQAKLDEAYDRLEQHAPDRLARVLRWLRNPKARWVRLAAGLLFIAAGLLGPVLPVLGVEFIPLGLLLVAQDFPPLREPVANMTLWLERQWVELRHRWQQRHA
jgi:membrane-bound ClpP family serine protease